MTFALHPRLAADTISLGRLNLCRVLLMNDARWPWFILVPEREGVREIFELEEEDQKLLHRETMLLSRSVSDSFRADKMNIAALGNVVPQLHVHVIARYENDATWPAPVWGKGEPVPYDAAGLERLRDFLLAVPGFKQAD